MNDLQKQIDETPKEVLVEVLKVAQSIYPEAYNKALATFLIEDAMKGIESVT